MLTRRQGFTAAGNRQHRSCAPNSRSSSARFSTRSRSSRSGVANKLGAAAGNTLVETSAALANQVARDRVVAKIKPLTLFFVVAMLVAAAGFLSGAIAGGDATPLQSPSTPPSADNRRDADTDPLPRGAIGRLGSQRYHVGGPAFQGFLTPDGKALLTRSLTGDTTVRLWDIATGKPIRSFEKVAGGQLGITLSPDGSLVALTSMGRDTQGKRRSEIHVYEAASGRLLHRLAAPGEILTISNDSKKLAVAYWGKQIAVWDLASETKVAELPAAPPPSLQLLAFTPDGNSLVSAGDDGRVEVWDIASQRRLQDMHEPIGRFASWLSISPDGTRLARADRSGKIPVWDLASGKIVQKIPSLGAVEVFVYSPDGRILATEEFRTGHESVICLRDARSGAVLRELPARVRSLSFSRDGKTLASVFDDGLIRVWDVASGELLHPTGEQPGTLVDISPDGTTIWAQAHGIVTAWDRSRARPLGSLSAEQCALSPDGRLLATLTSAAPEVCLYDARSRQPLRRFAIKPSIARAQTVSVRGIRFSSDGSRLVTIVSEYPQRSWPPLARLWDVDTGKEIRRGDITQCEPMDVAFSPDGRWIGVLESHIVSDGTRSTIKLLGTADDKATAPRLEIAVPGLENRSQVAFSPDGKMVTVNGNESLRI